MPTVEATIDLSGKSLQELEEEHRRIRTSTGSNFREIPDETLQYFVALTRELRLRARGGSKAATPAEKKERRKTGPVDLDSLI